MGELPFPKIPLDAPVDQRTIKRLSRAVLRSAAKGKRSRFDLLTKQNADRVEIISTSVHPNFTAIETDDITSTDLDPSIAPFFPKDFFEHPSAWIEAQPNIPRPDIPEPPKAIEDLWEIPYDISKVKILHFQTPNGEKQIVCKRLEDAHPEEVRMTRAANERGVPSAKVLGEIHDQGNHYLLLEKLNGMSLLQFQNVVQQTIDRLEASSTLPIPSDPDIQEKAAQFPNIAFQLKFLLDLKIHFEKQIIHFRTTEKPDATWLVPTEEIQIAYQKIRPFFSPFEQDFLDTTVQNIGTASSDRTVFKHLHENDCAELRIARKFFQRFIEAVLIKKKSLKDELRMMYYKRFTGFSSPAEIMQQMDRICQEAGIRHKDLAERNILVASDEKGHAPRSYVIDWQGAEIIDEATPKPPSSLPSHPSPNESAHRV